MFPWNDQVTPSGSLTRMGSLKINLALMSAYGFLDPKTIQLREFRSWLCGKALHVDRSVMMLWLWVTLLSFQHRPTAVTLKAVGGLETMTNFMGPALLCWGIIPVLSGLESRKEQMEILPCGYKSAH